MLVSGIAYIYAASAKPFVVRAANLMCQDVSLLGCPTSDGVSFQRRLNETVIQEVNPPDDVVLPPQAFKAASQAVAPRAVRKFLQKRKPDEGLGEVGSPRFLSLSRVVMTFANSRSRSLPTTETTSPICSIVHQICKAPAAFDASTACVCDGRKEQLAPGDSSSKSDAGQWFRGIASELTSPRRLKHNPWNHTLGAYCHAWPSNSEPGQWCFINPNARCSAESKGSYAGQAGLKLSTSSGPCGVEVESRSQLVIDGFDRMGSLFMKSTWLGLACLAVAGCVLLLNEHPSRQPMKRTGRLEDPGDEGDEEQGFDVLDEYSAQKLFEDGQREAVRKMGNQTPNELKFSLFGFYKQASDGDVTGPRPMYGNEHDRIKWDHWAKNRGMSRTQAIEGYLRTVALL